MKAYMQRLSFSGMVHHGGHRVAECGPEASNIGGVVRFSVYMTQNGYLCACVPMVTVSL